jgi:hypothetical protein
MGSIQQNSLRPQNEEEQRQQVYLGWRRVNIFVLRYLKAKDEEIKSKNKILESINTGMKESVTKINPEKLSKLPYDKEPILKDVFSTLYHILYN